MQGKRQECLEWIEKNWADMRPSSLVEAMEKAASLVSKPAPLVTRG
jgi:hypothetical protein